jgi:hypothetical protein
MKKNPSKYEGDTAKAKLISFCSSYCCYYMTLLKGLPERSVGRIRSYPLSMVLYGHITQVKNLWEATQILAAG